jgi:rhodanese-related sulfurtransferase
MTFTKDQIESNAAYFRQRLQAVKQLNDVKKWAKDDGGDFVLLDVRGRDAFAKAHPAGATCVPFEEIETLAAQLPRDRELVTFCWSHL